MNYIFQKNGVALNKEEHLTLLNFLITILNSPNTKLIYRGESLENLKEKLNISEHEDALVKLNQFIFKIGDKGRVYQEQYSAKLNTKNLFHITEISERFYKYIFEKIRNVIIKSKNPEILKFKERNVAFTDYFKNSRNLKDFISKIEKHSKEEQIQIRDYYLSLLHRVGKFGMFVNTMMLSTTLSNRVANKFTSTSDVIFVSWYRYRVSPSLKLIRSSQLPSFKSQIFLNQREITLKGGLFPHNILGFITRKDNILHVNPNIFNHPNKIEFMVKNGIPTNQDDFDEKLSQTKFSGAVYYDGANYSDTI